MRAGAAQAAWRALPVADLATIFGTGRTLLLAPHPDDESLGCGGMIAQSVRAGRPPLVVVVTDGTGSHPCMPAPALRATREQEAAAALRQLGLTEPTALVFLGLPDTRAPREGANFEAAVASITALARGCAAICAPWRGDPHGDHEATSRMAEAVATRTGIPHLAYPVWGWTLPEAAEVPGQAVAGWRLDITDALGAKQRAIAAHRSQLGRLADQSPDGFALPAPLLRAAERPYEVYLAT